LLQYRLRRDLLRLLCLDRAQRLAHRVDQLADRGLDDVELADLGVGVEQQVAKGLILAAELSADGREQLLVDVQRIVGQGVCVAGGAVSGRAAAGGAMLAAGASSGRLSGASSSPISGIAVLRARKTPSFLIAVIRYAPTASAEMSVRYLFQLKISNAKR
jgi:hypothetical protein